MTIVYNNNNWQLRKKINKNIILYWIMKNYILIKKKTIRY